MTTFSFTGEIPIDVMSTLTRLVGSAYPSAVMVPGPSLTFRIDDGDRADPSVFERAAELRAEADEYTADSTMRVTEDGVTMDPGYYLANIISKLAEAALEYHGPENFIEFEYRSGQDPAKPYLLTVIRSPAQRPAALLAAEKRRAEAAEARVDELTELLRRVGADDGVRTSLDEFAAELGINLD